MGEGNSKGWRKARYIIAERIIELVGAWVRFICGSVCYKVNDKVHESKHGTSKSEQRHENNNNNIA